MASIFRGTDLRNGRQVAIKVPHPEMEIDPVLFDRFHREEEIGKDLDHPGVMKVFTDDDRSQLYMVMEWVEGRLLRQILDEKKKLPPERAMRITLGICEALDYIHSHGVVHRDLKPENIMVDPEDHIKLIDFGIAGQAGARRLTFAKLSQVMGTPDYISPEQVKGKRGDARSDVYALGVMLYEMLTGKTPFPGPNPFAIMNDRLLNNPIPPREIDPAISPRVAGDYLSRHRARPQEPLCHRARNGPGSAASRKSGSGRTPRIARLENAPDALGAENPLLRNAGPDSRRHLRLDVLFREALSPRPDFSSPVCQFSLFRHPTATCMPGIAALNSRIFTPSTGLCIAYASLTPPLAAIT